MRELKTIFWLLLLLCFEKFSCEVNASCHCVFKRTISIERKLQELNQVCGRTEMDCTDINYGGRSFIPNTTSSHAAWAIDTWFRNQSMSQCYDPVESCSFGSSAQIYCQTCECIVWENHPDEVYQGLIGKICNLDINGTYCTIGKEVNSNSTTLFHQASTMVSRWFSSHSWDRESCLFPGVSKGVTSLIPAMCDDYLNWYLQKKQFVSFRLRRLNRIIFSFYTKKQSF